MPRLLIILALFTGAAWAQGSFYQLPAPLPNAVVRVCPTPAAGNPCSSPSAIFSDQALTQSLANPVTASTTGALGFWVSAGQYTIQIGTPYNQVYVISLGGGGGISGVVTGNQTLGGTNFTGIGVGPNACGAQIDPIVGASDFPGGTCYGFSTLDVSPGLITAPPATKTVIGVSVGMAAQYANNPAYNFWGVGVDIATPHASTTNQWNMADYYAELDHNANSTLHLASGVFAGAYNNGSGTTAFNRGGYFEAVNGFYGNNVFPGMTGAGTMGANYGIEVRSGINSASGATNTVDNTIKVDQPYAAGGTFSNSHTQIQVDDASAGGAISGAVGVNIATCTNGCYGLQLGNNKIAVSNATGTLTILQPASFAGNASVQWPNTQGFILSTTCSVGKLLLTSDFTSANASGLQAITGLSCAFFQANAASVPGSFSCQLTYSQATNVAGDQFGVGFSTNPVNLHAWGIVATNTGAATPFTTGDSGNITTSGSNPIVTFQPANTGINVAQIYGSIEPGTSGGTFQLYVANGTAADVIVIKRDSYCQIF